MVREVDALTMGTLIFVKGLPWGGKKKMNLGGNTSWETCLEALERNKIQV